MRYKQRLNAFVCIIYYNIMKLCFTGHRPYSLPFGYDETKKECIELKAILYRLIEKCIIELNVNHFITGMALGTDIICAEIVIELKKKYPLLLLECAIPCKKQYIKWQDRQKKRYFNILNMADKITLIQEEYTPECMMKRNIYMISQADYVIAIYTGNTKSGTYKTIQEAEKNNRGIFIINPYNLNFDENALYEGF